MVPIRVTTTLLYAEPETLRGSMPMNQSTGPGTLQGPRPGHGDAVLLLWYPGNLILVLAMISVPVLVPVLIMILVLILVQIPGPASGAFGCVLQL